MSNKNLTPKKQEKRNGGAFASAWIIPCSPIKIKRQGNDGKWGKKMEIPVSKIAGQLLLLSDGIVLEIRLGCNFPTIMKKFCIFIGLCKRWKTLLMSYEGGGSLNMWKRSSKFSTREKTMIILILINVTDLEEPALASGATAGPNKIPEEGPDFVHSFLLGQIHSMHPLNLSFSSSFKRELICL